MDWSKVKIGDLVESISKWNPKNNSTAPSFTYIDLSSIDKDRKLIHEVTIVHPSEAPSRARQLVQENDILVSTVRPNLNGVAMIGSEYNGATASTGYCVLRPIPEKILPSFLFHWVKTPHFISEMTRNSTGANYPAVSDKTIKEHLISLPPIDEQKRIAAILDKADEIKKDCDSSNQLHWNLINAIFSDIFGDITVNDNNWRLGDISEIAKVSSGYAFKSDWFTNKGTPVIRIGDIQEGFVSVTNAARIDEDSLEIKERFRLLEGDILMALSGATTGKIGMVSTKERGSYLNQRIANIRPNSTHFGAYIYHLFSNKQIIDKLIKQAGGSAQPNLSPKDLEGFIIPIPENTELSIFNSIANQILNNKQHTDNRLEDVLLLAQSSVHLLIN